MQKGEEGWFYWWITERIAGLHLGQELVGVTGFKGPPTPGGTVEMLYGLAPSGRRRGLGTICVQLLLDWAFRHQEVKRVIMTINPDNVASQRLARKCGMSLVAEVSDDEWLVFAIERGAQLGA